MVRSRGTTKRIASNSPSLPNDADKDDKKDASRSKTFGTVEIWLLGLVWGISLGLLASKVLMGGGGASSSAAAAAAAAMVRGSSVLPTSNLNQQQPRNELAVEATPKKRAPKQSTKAKVALKKPANPQTKKQENEKAKTKDKKESANKDKEKEVTMHPLQHYFDLSEAQGHNKTRILKLLRDNADITALSEETYQALPTWPDITSMYGYKAHVIGKKFHCEAFLGDQKPVNKKWLAPAGHFNTGTNLLSDAIVQNCDTPNKDWQVPWGKHNPPKTKYYREQHQIPKYSKMDSNQTLPIVLIRDPFRWHQSMCHNSYTASWPRLSNPQEAQFHCPNLWPTDFEQRELKRLGYKIWKEGDVMEKETPGLFRHVYFERRTIQEGTRDPISMTPLTDEELKLHHFPVKIKYCGNQPNNYTRHHFSTVHMYNDWYEEYYKMQAHESPRLMTRMEDLLFFPDEVIPAICACAGTKMLKKHAKVSAASTKAEGHTSPYGEKMQREATGYISALIKYGNPKTRLKGFTPQDVQYASHYLDKELMKMFGYKVPAPTDLLQAS